MTLEERRRQALARLASRRPARTRPERPGWPPETQPSGSPRSDADWETYLDDRDARIARFLEPDADEDEGDG